MSEKVVRKYLDILRTKTYLKSLELINLFEMKALVPISTHNTVVALRIEVNILINSSHNKLQ